jgi:general secretion pathway protein A
MYEQFFGLTERPFELTVRPRFVFLTAGHREALAALQYGVSTGRALTLVLGEAGTGKTTVAYAAMDDHRGHNITPVYLSNPTITRPEFVEWLAGAFRLSGAAATSKVRLLRELERALIDRRTTGNPWVLIVDEAQSLPDELLEEIRLITNLEHAEEKLLPVVLLGQPELGERLGEPGMRHLKQRIAVRCTLGPLGPRETAAYVAKRIRVAGGDGVNVFTREAVELIHRRSGGVPRTINVICDNALVSGYALGRRPVDRDVVDEVSRELEFTDQPQPPMHRAVPVNGSAVSQQGPAITVRSDPASLDTPTANAGDAPAMFAAVTKRRRFLFF